jgi:hypothetical protein
MSTLKEITTEEEWSQHVASLPPTTLQIISFHAPWAARELPFIQRGVVGASNNLISKAMANNL